MATADRADAIVIGAGVIGAAVALELARSGRRVVCVDKGPAPGAGSTSASSSIIRFSYTTLDAVLTSWEAAACWRDWIGHLGVEDPAGMARFVPAGNLVYRTPDFDGTAVLAAWDDVGIPYELLDPAALRARFPAMDHGRYFPPKRIDDPAFAADATAQLHAFYNGDSGYIDDPMLAAHNLAHAARRHGAEFRLRRTVTAIPRAGGRVGGVELDGGESIGAPVVVNVGGPHSAHLNALAGVIADMRITNRPLRQEVFAVPAPAGMLLADGAPFVADLDLGQYFRPQEGGTILVGGTEAACDELEWIDDADVFDDVASVEGWERATLRLARRVPALGIPNRPVGLAALYDVSDDWVPIYDRSSLDGFFMACGTSGNQFKNAPMAGQFLRALVDADAAGIDHDAEPIRFSGVRTGRTIDLGAFSRLRAAERDVGDGDGVRAAELGGLAAHDAELFELRLHRWLPDLRDGLAVFQPPDVVDQLTDRLIAIAASAFAGRDAELKRLDMSRTLEPDWFQHPRILGYAAYADRFGATLRGVAEHLDHLQALGVTYLHLMPLLQPRPGPNDGGYAVADHRAVHADLGTIDDLRALATTLRRAGISLCLDLVVNHVAREHAWAVAARAGDERYRRYFRIFPDRVGPDAYERTLPEVFPDFAPGSFTWDDDVGGWVWTTFNAWQWDLDWSNPDVLCEFADLILFLANLGVEIIRLDAIAFLWKRLGTTCQNEPEVHAITQVLRAVARIAAPAVVFKAEAIVAPEDLVPYLGRGRHHGKVSDLAYHNSLMVQIWSMLASRDARLSVHTLRRLGEVPATTAWITYVRCHDDIGWAIDDADAATVGLDGFAHRRFLADYYSGDFWESPARGVVFQSNPVTGDRRISGMLASLAGLDAALESARADAVEDAVRRILLVQTIILGWGGVPVLWMGDEIGLRNDPHWADDPTHADDNRWIHRPPMPWEAVAHRHVPGSLAGQVFDRLAHRIRVRAASLPHLHASVRSEPLDPTDPGVFAVLRRHPLGPFLALYNVTDTDRPFPAWRLTDVGLVAETVIDALTGATPPIDVRGDLRLAPYEARWLVSSTRTPGRP